MNDFFGLVGVAVLLVVIFGSGGIMSAFREYRRQGHVERMVAQLPEAERGAFVRSYLDDPKTLNKKLAEAGEL